MEKNSENKHQKSAPVEIKVKIMLIMFYNSDKIIHKKFVPQNKTVNGDYYLGIMKRLLAKID